MNYVLNLMIPCDVNVFFLFMSSRLEFSEHDDTFILKHIHSASLKFLSVFALRYCLGPME